VVDEKLRAASEEVGQRSLALVCVEAVVLLYRDPGQLPPLPGELVAAPGQLFLGVEQLEAGRKPLLSCSRRVFRPRWTLVLVMATKREVGVATVRDLVE
jgi:hypothetical protein